MHSNPTDDTRDQSTIEGFQLSPQQARVWQWQRGQLMAVLHMRVPAETSEARLRQSLLRVIDRHEILRTRYRRLPGMSLPVQELAPSAALRWQPAPEAGAAAERPVDDPVVTLSASPDGDRIVRLQMPAAHADSASLHQLAASWARAYLSEADAASDDDDLLQYADYAAWRDELVASQPQAQAFWDRMLAARAPASALPMHVTAPASATRALSNAPAANAPAGALADASTAALTVPVPPALRDLWTRRAASWDLDPAVLALAAWIALLHRHIAAELLTVDLDWQVRDSFLIRSLGLFSEPLPLTLSALDDHGMETLCPMLHRRAAELLEWRDYFPSTAPTADAGALAFRHVPAIDTAALTVAGWRIDHAHSPTAPHLLLLEHRADTGALVLHHDHALYAPAAAEILADQLVTLLDHGLRDPARPLPALPVASASEQQRVAEVFSRAEPLSDARAGDYARVAALPHLAACFAEQLAQHADQPAIQGAGGCLRYTELDDRSARLAKALLARGIAPGRRVAHFLPRDIDAIVAMLAILRAGASYVPIDPDYPAGRIAYVLDDCDADVILTRRYLAPRLPASWQDSARVVFTEDPPATATASPWPTIRPTDEAYLIYTSGSTGAPKGVPITHAGALHSLAARIAYYPDPVRGFLLLSSFAFDSSIAGLFWTLAQGGCLHVCTEAEQKDPARLAALVRERGITHLLALPSLYQVLLDALGREPTALGTAIVAGEACPRALVQAHHRTLPGARLYNEYGPTEAAVWSTVAACTPAPDDRPVPIGRPIPHTRAHLLDEHGQPVARGIAGEIYLGGPGLSPGYLHRPELTADRFVHIAGERLYRTGDRAYRDEQGALVFLGRNDGQVKIRGHRIELGEIEAALCRVIGAEQAVVLAAPGTDGQLALRGFVELSPHARTLDHGALRDALATLLPDYMIPGDVQVLPALPRLANGKLDRPALLALAPQRTRPAYAAPHGHTEKVLAALWEALLDVPHMGRHDDFFALGGHSLLAVRLVHRIQATLHVDIAVSAVIRHATLAALAAHIDGLALPGESEAGAPGSALVCQRPGQPGRAPLFCLHQPSGDVHHYLPLIESLPAAQPVYGVPLPNGRTSDNSTLAELAADYLGHIRALQPAGPYHLCGWSMGGLLALELCHQLEQQGERVAFLALVDTTFETADEPAPFDELLARCRAELKPESAARLDAMPADVLDALRAATADRGRLAQMRYLLHDWLPRYGLALATPDEVIALALDAMQSARRWVSRYRPPVVAADLHLWWAEDTLARRPGLPRAWQDMTRGRLHHTTVPGDHDRILHQPALHASFCAALARATGGPA